MKRLTVGLAATMVLICAGQAQAAIVGTALGTAAAPATLGGFTMTAFGDDARATIADVTSVASPLGGTIDFSIAMSHREVGAGWATWNPFYTGDVYWTKGATAVTIDLPTSTGAFYLYAEPNSFATFEITAETVTGMFVSISQDVKGDSGAAGYGFHTTEGEVIVDLKITSDEDFAVGEFGIAKIPEPATCVIWSLLGLVGVVFAWRRRRRAQ